MNGSFVSSEQGSCSVANVTKDSVQVSQAYNCVARGQSSQPPLLLDGVEATATWNATEYAAHCYDFRADLEPFIALSLPTNWCISTLNLTFYVDTPDSISIPSNTTLQSSNTEESFSEESDHEFTQSTHELSDNRAVLTYELAHNVCDAHFLIKLSGCIKQACKVVSTHYYLCEVDAFQIRGDLPSGEYGVHPTSLPHM